MDRAARPLRAVRGSPNGRGGVDVEEFELFDELSKCRRRQSSGLVEHEFALLEGHQCRNRPDLSRRREFLLRFGVDLCKYHVGVLLGGGRERRCERQTGTAPPRPKVAQDDVVAVDDVAELVSGDVFE
jgi:hypothetical protein